MKIKEIKLKLLLKYNLLKIKYEEIYNKNKPIIINKLKKYDKKYLNFLNKLGFARLVHGLRYCKNVAKKLIPNLFIIMINGAGIVAAINGILSPLWYYNVIGYGLGLYISTKLISKIWKEYVVGKIMINGNEIPMEIKQNDMGQYRG